MILGEQKSGSGGIGNKYEIPQLNFFPPLLAIDLVSGKENNEAIHFLCIFTFVSKYL